MNEAAPGLFIGDWHDARDSKDMLVVTVAADSPFTGQNKFGLVDGPGNERRMFDAAVDYVVRRVLDGDQPVLVHCIAGQSRSAAVVVAASARILQTSYCVAYDALKVARPSIRIHPALSLLLLTHMENHEIA